MNIIHAGDSYQVYSDGIESFDRLPKGTYNVMFQPLRGFSLTTHNNLSVQEKIYGNIPRKVKKALTGYKTMTRNFGILLSGKKGIGKSLFVRYLAAQAYEENYPVIIVDTYYPGIANFLSKIEQDVIIIFDEFEKTFAKTDDINPQDEMLTLFDGLDGGHKLFVVTCNDLSAINDYMLNRPGRFHYHITLSAPTPDEVREYMQDKVLVTYWDEIEDVVNLSNAIDMPYDFLRAIAFELNQGYSLKEAMEDLNISNTDEVEFNIKAYRKDGSCWTAYRVKIDFTDTNTHWIYVYKDKEMRICREIRFDPSLAHIVGKEYMINEKIEMYPVDPDDFFELETEELRKQRAKEESENTFDHLILERVEVRYYKYV